MTPPTVTVKTVTLMDGSHALAIEGMLPRESAMADPQTKPEDGEMTIDDLAAHTRIPSRTIRFYQSSGALPKPTIRGRVAYYGPAHVARLEQITVLQDRGLQIKAIRDVLARADKGEFSLQEWLGSHDQLSTPWAGDRPRVMSEEELQKELSGRRPGLVAELMRIGAVERRSGSYFVESPGLLTLALRLDGAGVPLASVEGAFKLLRKHISRLAEDLTSYFVKNADALGDRPDSALDELRPVSIEAVRLIFAREMDRTVGEATETGAVVELTKKRRAPRR